MTTKGRKISVIGYFPDVWMIKINGNMWSALTWAAREFIKSTAWKYDIVMCMDNDLIVPVESIVEYWCQYSSRARHAGHYLTFLIYDRMNVTERYTHGLMSFLRYPLVMKPNSEHFAHSNYSYKPDYYLPFWILGKHDMKRIMNRHDFFQLHHNELIHPSYGKRPKGYRIKNIWTAQEEAYFHVFEMFKELPVVGVICKGEINYNRTCTVHPHAFIHHAPDNYGNNERFVKQEQPQPVERLYCVEPSTCDTTAIVKIQKELQAT
eukprot:PhF_6_TR44502/c0_g1_i1/m.68543